MGPRYRIVFLLTSPPAASIVALGTVAILSSFYEPSLGELAIITGFSSVAVFAAVVYSLARARADFERVLAWRELPAPSPAETVEAWDAAANLPMRSFRRDAVRVSALSALPCTLTVVLVLGLEWYATPVLLLACAIAAGYGTVLNYSMSEFLMRPAIEEIAASLPEDFVFTRNGLPIRKRLVIGLPVFTAMTGVVVAALVTDGGGTGLLAVTVIASLGVGAALSLELGVLLSRSITDPIAGLRTALASVRAGDFDVRVAVISSDELGELTDDFNRMAKGLAEREQLREVFGTYLDKDVARFILSGRFPEEGVAVDVSIMFVDVRDFTPFAERADPQEVVGALNTLFETIVPIVDRHGGHVDKFMGDGLLAVFGAPENHPDHADRALGAGLDIVAAVNGDAGSPLQIGVGINSGTVVAGSIGGAGRLNFSVIGDPVNVAARVEAATRETGDDLLVTAATRAALRRPVVLHSRGTVALKGKRDPVEVLAAPGSSVPAETSSGARGRLGV